MTELLQRYNADQLHIPDDELWAVEAPVIPEPEPEPGMLKFVLFFSQKLLNFVKRITDDTVTELLQYYNASQLHILDDELWSVEAPVIPKPEPQRGTICGSRNVKNYLNLSKNTQLKIY